MSSANVIESISEYKQARSIINRFIAEMESVRVLIKQHPSLDSSPPPDVSQVLIKAPRDLPILDSEEAPCLLVANHATGHLVDFNRAFSDLLGWSKDELTSKFHTEFIHPDDRDDTEEARQDLLTGQYVVDLVNRWQTKTGHYVKFYWQAFVDHDSGYTLATATVIP
jgi:PAS domain S-box-containing protein